MDTASNRRTAPSDSTEMASFLVPEMDCPSCAAKITTSVESLAGIETVDPQVMTGSIAVTYDPEQTDQPAIIKRIEAAGYTVEGGTEPASHSISVSVPEMDCPSCANKIITSVQQLAGIYGVNPDVTTGTVHVEYNPSETTVDRIHERIESTGYAVETRQTEQTDTFDVPEMDCPSCAGKIKNALEQRTGITAYETQPTTGTVTVTYDPDQLS